MAEQARNTIIEIKADLGCSRCYRKIKRLLCKYHQIRNQIFDEKQNTVIITVYCCSPERILHKLESKGGRTIHSIKIKEEADIKKGGSNNKKPKQEEEEAAVASKPPPPSPKKTDATPTPDVKQKEKQNPKPTSPPLPPVDANPIIPPPPKKGDGAKKGEGPPPQVEKQQGGEGVVIEGDNKKEMENKSKKGGGGGGAGGEGVKFIMDPVAAAPGYPSQWYPNSVYIPQVVHPATYYDSYGYYYNNGGGYGRTGVCDCGGGGRSICQNRYDCNFSEENATACLIM